MIRNAVLAEFQRCSYGEIYLSKIAKGAGVSRGSLYKYFYDRNDIIQFALQQTWMDVWKFDQDALMDSGGDFWEMMKESLSWHLERCNENPIYRLVYLQPEGVQQKENSMGLEMETMVDQHREWIYKHMNRMDFRIISQEEFEALQDTCYALLFLSVQKYLVGNGTKEEIETEFAKRLDKTKAVYMN